MELEPKISERQVGMLSHLFRDRRDRLPEEWRNRAGYRDGDCDWRQWNLERWAENHLTKRAASAIIAALMEDNDGGARTMLEAARLPKK